MKRIFPVLGLAMILAGCGNDNTAKTSSTGAATPASSSTNYSVNYLGTLAASEKSMEKTADVASINKALEQFNVQEGHFPKDLSELVPAYIGHVPVAPIGYQLTYDPAAGEVKVVKVSP